MLRKNFRIEVIMSAERECFIVRDEKGKKILTTCNSGDELLRFFREDAFAGEVGCV